MNDAGRIGFVVKGNYSSTATYNFLDVVYYGNSSYVAKKLTTGNTPTDNSEYWQVLAKTPASTVTGIKGNSETTYRTGNINLTPENLGALPCSEIIHNGDFNHITKPGFYAMTGNSVNGPVSGSNRFSLLVLENDNLQSIHQIAIMASEEVPYIRYGNTSISWWSDWKKIGLDVDDVGSNTQPVYFKDGLPVVCDGFDLSTLGGITSETIHNGDFNDAIRPGFYTMTGSSANRPDTAIDHEHSLIVLDNVNSIAFHQIAIPAGDKMDIYIRWGVPEISTWSKWKKIGFNPGDVGSATQPVYFKNGLPVTCDNYGLKFKTFFSGNQSISGTSNTKISVGIAKHNAFEGYPILVIETSDGGSDNHFFCYTNSGYIGQTFVCMKPIDSTEQIAFYTFRADYFYYDDSQITFSNGHTYTLTANTLKCSNSGPNISKIIGIGL